jgi:hypothetical protein
MTAIDPQLYRGLMTDADIAAMNERTEVRRQAAIKRLGPAWLGHARGRDGVPVGWPSIGNVSILKRKAAK